MWWVIAALAANPGKVPVQGVIAEAGAVTNGTRALTFRLLGGVGCATERWSETQTVALDTGVFQALLGSVTTLDLALFAEPGLCLTVAVAGGPPSDPVPLAMAPYAAFAQDTARFGGLGPDRYVLDDETRPWSSLDLSGAPDRIRLGYSAGTGITISGAEISTQPPYAVGDGLALSGTTLSAVPYTAGAGLALNGRTFSVAGGTPTFDGVKLGTVAGNCTTAAERGTMRYDSSTGAFQACTPSGWATFASVRDGASAATAATSCTQLRADIPSATNGAFWLDPNLGASTDAFQAWCDFTASGGPYVYRNYLNLKAYYSFDHPTAYNQADWGAYAGTFEGASNVGNYPPYAGFGKSSMYNNADTTRFALSPAVAFAAQSTMMFWARSTACNNNEIAVYLGGVNDWAADLVFSGTRLYTNSVDRMPLGTSACAQDTWAHYAYVDTGTELRGYKNGALLSTSTNYATLAGKSVTHLGGYAGHGTNVLGGQIDDFAVYDRALSTTEISAIYTLGTQGKPLRYPN